jgi:ribose-phosphate pyrophosphokinase
MRQSLESILFSNRRDEAGGILKGMGQKVFLAHSAEHWRRSLEKHGIPVGRHETFFFADQERGYRLREQVKGKTTALIACVLPDPTSFFELLALHRLLIENEALWVDLIIPYLGYARQDRSNQAGEASLGVMVVELVRALKKSKLILFDVHSPRIRKALGPSSREISALPLFTQTLSAKPPEAIVSPDAGSVFRARRLAGLFKPKPMVAVIEKIRPRPNVAIAKRLHGDVRRKDVLVIDDMIDTGGTVSEAVRLVSEHGARSIRLAATHGIFSGDARDRLSKLPVEEILVTNTLPQIPHPRIRTLDIVPFLLSKKHRV